MINLNREAHKIYTSKNVGEITEPYYVHKNNLEVYIDCEVLTQCFINKNKNDIIYLIGMSWICPTTNKLIYKSFITSSLDPTSEKIMLKQWWSAVKKLKEKTKSTSVILYHWSGAEDRYLKKAFLRHKSLSYIKSNLNTAKYQLRDLMEMFIDAEVVIKNVWGYSVKNIARGLYKHGFISEIWNDNGKGSDVINSGEGTIVAATKCYKETYKTGNNIQNNKNFDSIINYNKIDCNVLYYLLLF